MCSGHRKKSTGREGGTRSGGGKKGLLRLSSRPESQPINSLQGKVKEIVRQARAREDRMRGGSGEKGKKQ